MRRAATLRIVRGLQVRLDVGGGGGGLAGHTGWVPASCGLKRSPAVLDIAITGVEVHDVRFPTSRTLAGSDAMNEAPDYSAAYVVLATDAGLSGHGMTFTIGRGTEIVVAAIRALAPRVVGLRLADVAADPGRFWRTRHRRLAAALDRARRRARSTSRPRRSSTPCGTCGRRPRASRCGSSSATCRRASSSAASTSATSPTRSRRRRRSRCSRPAPTAGRSARPRPPRRLLAYTTSVGWLGFTDDEVRRRARDGRRRGLDAREDEGRRRPGRRRAPRRAHPRGDRARRAC